MVHSQRDQSKDQLRKIKPSCPTVRQLRILVHGPVGAGKSSFTNSIDSIFQGRMMAGAAVESANADGSFTKRFQILNINDGQHESFLPFAFCDTMGLENEPEKGVVAEDLVKVLKGHIRDGYMFNPTKSCSDKDQGYNSYPTLADRIHCMICVIPSTTISMMEDDIIKKMRSVRAKAADMRVPQVVVLTKIDMACQNVAKDLQLVYKSKTIRKRMEECSNRLGVPLNCIFPIKNYHEEIALKNDVDVLLLSAMNFILNFANDHLAAASRDGLDFGPRMSLARDLSSMEHSSSSMEHDVNFRSQAPSGGDTGNRSDSSKRQSASFPVVPRP
ncbi:interferon-induced protein 44-like [Engraulis encrasicolus]|uniref:interferon-induced protein 44-like n=1 Tax=Engraulis encrasicolus TaxID=184585 RepID=UPI002FD2D08B